MNFLTARKTVWPKRFCVLLVSFWAGVFLCFCSGSLAAETWQNVKSEHFDIAYKNAPRSFIDSVVEASERYYRETTETLGITRYKSWTWKDRVKIFIYDDAAEYTAVTRMGWSGASVSVKLRTIRTYPLAQGFFDSVLPHELAHIVFREFVGFGDNVPLWLDEGFAMYHEKSRRVGASGFVRKVLKDGSFVSVEGLSLMDLNSASKDEIELFYNESASLVGYLINELEVYRFVRLCRELKDGRRFEWALPKAYMKFQNIRQLESAWKEYVTNEKNR